MVAWYQMAIVLGFFTVFLVTYFIGGSNTDEYNNTEGWRYMFWSELVPCLLFLGLLFFVPKSPRWLILKGRETEARDILNRVHGEELAEKEMKEIQESIANDPSVSIRKTLAAPFLGIVIIGTIFSMLQQFTGINAVLYYGVTIFEEVLNIPSDDSLRQQLLLAGVNVVCTIIAMWQVDKWGRRPLIFLGCIGMFLGFSMCAITLMIDQVSIISLIGILMFVGSFALSMGPVVWVVLAEMFPNAVRSTAMAIAVAMQWLSNFIVAQSFPVIAGSEVNKGPDSFWNGSLPYFIFMGFIAIIIIFAYKYIPETKGKSLEDIEEMWKKNPA